MKFMKRSKRYRNDFLWPGCVMLFVTVTTHADETPALQALRSRAAAYWQAQEQEDWHTLFRFVPPGYLRNISEADFVEAKNRLEKLHFSEATIHRIEPQGDHAWVEVAYRYRPRNYPTVSPHQARIWDVWKREQNQYYPVPPELRQTVPALPPIARADSEEKALAARLHQFWQAREQQDQTALYGLLNPAYRQQVDLATFRKKRPFYQYLIHKLDWVEVPLHGRQGRARVTFSYRINDRSVSKMAPREESAVQEWIKVDEQWYRNIPPERTTPVANPEKQGDQGV